jgi:hypothetical protein
MCLGVGHGQYWVIKWGQEPKKQFHFGHYVHLKGGEYFFAPSFSGLRALCGGSETTTAIKKNNNIKSDTKSNEILPTEISENRTQNTNTSQKSNPKSKSQPQQKRTTSKVKSK